jgi:hypothetical protein
VITLLPLSAMFAVRAFLAALSNWQLRTGKMGTWREFFATADTWWPGQ